MVNHNAGGRPDKCGLLMRLDDGGGMVFQPVTDSAALLGAVEFIAELIQQQIPTYISIPTRPGFTNSRVQLNAPDMVIAAVAGNLTQVASLLQGAIAFAARSQTDPERPIQARSCMLAARSAYLLCWSVDLNEGIRLEFLFERPVHCQQQTFFDERQKAAEGRFRPLHAPTSPVTELTFTPTSFIRQHLQDFRGVFHEESVNCALRDY
jgi:hypothetical protein